MNIKNFRSYELAVNLYGQLKSVNLPYHLRDQLLRAGSSIVLNLAEGAAKASEKERLKFYRCSLGSLREIQAIADLDSNLKSVEKDLDVLGAHLYRLTHPR